MKTNPLVALILLITGAAIQNILWYIRLQDPILLREFQMYWTKDGARMFLDFNIMNYFFLGLVVMLYLIISLINRRRKQKNDVKGGKDE